MGTTGQDLALKPLKAGPGRGLTGQTMVSALIAIGISTIGLAGVATMISYSQRAGRSAQGLSDAGLLTDSIRSILSNSDRCKVAFQVVPSGGGTPVAPVLASDGSSVQLSSIGTSSGSTFTPYATAGQKFGSITITGMTLTRNDASSMTLSLTASRGEGAIGGAALTIQPLIGAARFDSSTGAITSCMFSGLGGGTSPTGTSTTEASNVPTISAVCRCGIDPGSGYAWSCAGAARGTNYGQWICVGGWATGGGMCATLNEKGISAIIDSYLAGIPGATKADLFGCAESGSGPNGPGVWKHYTIDPRCKKFSDQPLPVGGFQHMVLYYKAVFLDKTSPPINVQDVTGPNCDPDGAS